MTHFAFRTIPDLPDRCSVGVGDHYELTVTRTGEGLLIHVHPVTGGEVWFLPLATFTVSDADVEAGEG